MKEYDTHHLRNVAVAGHGSSGKTSLVSALAFVSGSSSRLGSAADGSSLTDFTPDEIERKISINLALAYAEWMDTKINLIDTPGYLDFSGEVLAALRVADAALVVVPAHSGVEVGTEIVWQGAMKAGIPRLFFVNMMDKERADFEKVVAQLRQRLSPHVVPIEFPLGWGENFRGAVNLLTQRAALFKKGSMKGEETEAEVPAEVHPAVDRYQQQLIDSVAETDDALLEKYLEGQALGREEIVKALRAGVREGRIFPLLVGAATQTHGVRSLLTALVELLPSPGEAPPQPARRKDSGGDMAIAASDSGPLAALVFKTTTEPHVGEQSYFRIYGGRIATGGEVLNVTRGYPERLVHLSILQGRERIEVPALHAGDIGVVAKLKETHTNDTLGAREAPSVLAPIVFPEAAITIAIAPRSRGDEEKISTGLAKLQEEDPTFHSRYDGELKQMLIAGMGELHLDVIVGRLKRKFGVEAELRKPRIPYRESIRVRAEGQGKYKRQTGGHGQYGDCWIRLEPLPRGSGMEFDDAIVGGVIPNKYIPSVEKGVREAAEKGILASLPTTDFRATLYDGSYHSVDSSDIAFKIAGSLAFQSVGRQAKPYLLEPIWEVEIVIPEDVMGDVIGDLNARRGKILGIEPRDQHQVIKAHVPQAEMYKYSTSLRSLTQGRGAHTWRPSHYEEVPGEIAERIIAEAQAEKEGEK